jgi:hypothetical protein
MFFSADLVPLLVQVTRLQPGSGVSTRMSANVSFYANAVVFEIFQGH